MDIGGVSQGCGVNPHASRNLDAFAAAFWRGSAKHFEGRQGAHIGTVNG
jgi:hypothetical protein